MVRRIESLLFLPFTLLARVFDILVRPLVNFGSHHALVILMFGFIYFFLQPYWPDLLRFLHIL